MNFKRILATLIATVMVGSALVACSGDTSSSSGANSDKSSSKGTASVEETEKITKITMVNPMDSQPDQAMVQSAWNEYLKPYGLEFDLILIPWSEISDKRAAMLAANEKMDMLFTMGADYYSDIAKNTFAPLNNLIDEYGQDIKSQIHPRYLDGPKVDGELYMIPTNKELASARCMYVRKDIIEKYDLKISEDMGIDELEPVFKIIKENEPDMFPTTLEGLVWYTATANMIKNQSTWEGVQGSDWLFLNLETGKADNIFNIPTVNGKYSTIKNYKDKGYIHEGELEKTVTQSDAVRLGETAFWGGMNKPAEASLEMARHGLKEEPVMISGMKPIITTFGTVCGAGIVSYSENKEETMKLMNLLWSDKDLIQLVNSGIEGKHYVKSEKGEFLKKLPEGIENPADTGFNQSYFWEFGNDMLNLVWDTQPADIHEQFTALNNSANVSPALGFYFNQEPVKNEMAALFNVFVQYDNILGRGDAEDVDATMKEAQEKMIASGLNVVVTELEQQYLDWKSTK